MTKSNTKTVMVGLTDDEYAGLLRLAADMKLKPNQAMQVLLRGALTGARSTRRDDGGGGGGALSNVGGIAIGSGRLT